MIVSINTFPQSMTQQERQSIIASLDSLKHWVRQKAILDILRNNISEALPVLEKKIFQQEQDIAVLFLQGIMNFQSSNAIGYAHKFLDTLEYLSTFPPNSKRDLKLEKFDVTKMLFQMGDYSTVDIYFEYLSENTSSVWANSPRVLSDIIKYAPEYEYQVKTELKRIIYQEDLAGVHPEAIRTLWNFYGDEIIPDLINLFSSARYYNTRLESLSILDEINYPKIDSIMLAKYLHDKMNAESIFSRIILDYCTPKNYCYVVNNMNNALDQNEIKYQLLYLKNFQPSPPKYYDSLSEYINYSLSLCDTLLNYNWVGTLALSKELKSYLSLAKTALFDGDSLTCRARVKSFQDLVDNVYKDSLNSDARFVTMEGWKFLYWNAQYIIDRLPADVWKKE